jgi:hypothetical protein
LERLANGEPLVFQDASWAEHSLDGPISGTTRVYSIFKEDEDLVVMFLCSAYRGDLAPVNPTCDGHVWDRTLNLVLYMRFPSDQGQAGTEERWRQPVEAAIELIQSWER